MMQMGVPIDDIFEAARNAGRHLVNEGRKSQKTLDTVGRELLPRDMYIGNCNQYCEQTLNALGK